VVLFRRQALLLRFRPEDGLHVLVRGRASVYEQRGQLQLVAETMEPVGAGSLQLAFEQLKERLKAEGLFDAERKRPLPAFPRTVGIVTSPTGAVIRDFLNIVSRRHSGLNVLLFPVSVQGESAPAEIEAAISEFNASHLVDVIVLARGGGSLEDLAAFNSERVARAIASSELPLVSAVGHETDFTIADFVADLRAPTPSAAAELITEAQHMIAERLAEQSNRLDRAVRFQLLHARRSLADLPADRIESRIAALLYRLGQRLDDATLRMDAVLTGQLHAGQKRAADLGAKILHHDPRRNLAHAREQLAQIRARLDRSTERSMQSASARLGSLDARLHSLSPLAVLDRGYALVLSSDGALIRSTAQVAQGNSVTTRLADGKFTSRVETTERNRERNKTRAAVQKRSKESE
jgi:exodeoxyribonuclease VII large subunit